MTLRVSTRVLLCSSRASLLAQSVKNVPAMQKPWCSIPGSGRSPGEGNGNPLQYSCLENPVDKGTWRATVHGVSRVGHDWVTFTTTTTNSFYSLSPTPGPLPRAFELWLSIDSLHVWWLQLSSKGTVVIFLFCFIFLLDFRVALVIRFFFFFFKNTIIPVFWLVLQTRLAKFTEFCVQPTQSSLVRPHTVKPVSTISSPSGHCDLPSLSPYPASSPPRAQFRKRSHPSDKEEGSSGPAQNANKENCGCKDAF